MFLNELECLNQPVDAAVAAGGLRQLQRSERADNISGYL
jgi:hypothetical protein